MPVIAKVGQSTATIYGLDAMVITYKSLDGISGLGGTSRLQMAGNLQRDEIFRGWAGAQVESARWVEVEAPPKVLRNFAPGKLPDEVPQNLGFGRVEVALHPGGERSAEETQECDLVFVWYIFRTS